MQGKSLAFSCDIARRYAEQLSQQPYAQQGYIQLYLPNKTLNQF